MRARLEKLVAALREADVAVSIAEAMDAARAAALVGIERPALREALAATLVKDERDRAAFVAAFDAAFPARPGDVVASGRGRRGARRGGGEGGEAGGSGGTAAGAAARGIDSAAGSTAARRDAAAAAEAATAPKPAASAASEPTGAAAERSQTSSAERSDRSTDGAHASDPDDSDAESGAADANLARLVRERGLLRMPFRAMTPLDVEACADIARAIAARITARVRRRLRPRPTGRLDFRRTIRAAVPHGGVPFERRWRGRRAGAPDFVALCDLSASTATATEFFLSLLVPAAAHFRRVRLFGFVDRLVEIELEDGQVRPAAAIDLMARSDFGRVLRDLMEHEADALGPDAVLVILGDARNNRLPPRADLLAAARARVRRVLWLNPDPPEHWNTGDSVIATYARHADAVVACGNLAELERALGAVARL